MLASTHWYPEGRLHVVPLMNLSLPGIDPNDIKKSLVSCSSSGSGSGSSSSHCRNGSSHIVSIWHHRF